MKPSQFRRIEKSALQQKNYFKQRIDSAGKTIDTFGEQRAKDSLKNLVSTMKNLKSK